MQSTRLFGGLTQDLSNKFAAMDAIFGVEAMFPAPDLYHTDYFLCLGSDPSGSHLTAVSVPNAIEAIRGIRARGGDVTFVNPRRIRAVEMGLGDHLQIKPDTDAYLLAAMLTEIDRLGGWDDDGLAGHGRHVDELREFIAPFDAESVAAVTGLSPDDIRRTARDFATAPTAIAHMGTGGNMGRQGTLVYWLLQMVNLVTGNLGRAGGGLLRGQRTGETFDELPDRFFDSPVGPVRHTWGHVPANLMAEYVHADRDPLRALIVIGGNPIMAVPGEERLREAFPAARARRDHGPVPQRDRRALRLRASRERLAGAGRLPGWRCRDRADRAVLRRGRGAGGRPRRGVVDPGPHRTGARPAVRTRRRHRLRAAVNEAMANAAGTTIDELRTLPSNTKVLPPYRSLTIEEAVAYTDGRVDCCPPSFAPVLDRAREIFAELQGEPPETLKLIQWRNRRQHNTWGRRLMPRLARGRVRPQPAVLPP